MKIIVNDKKIVASILQSIHDHGHVNIECSYDKNSVGDYFFHDPKMFPVRDGKKVIGYISRVDVDGSIGIIIYNNSFERKFITKHLTTPRIAYKITKEYQEKT